MINRYSVLFVTVVGLGVILQPHNAEAAAVGQSCSALGTTQVSDDHRNAAMCLDDGTGSLVWKQITGAPQPIANNQGKPVAHFENGSVVWNAPAPKSESAAAAPAPRALLATAPSRWEGWYAGVNAGYAGTTNSTTDPYYLNNGATYDFNINGATAGLVGGYNWIPSGGGMFYGVEADINYLGNDGKIFSCPSCANQEHQWQGYGTIRGRAGVTSDSMLAFLTAGLAVADVRDKLTSVYSANPYTATSTGLSVGWTAGAGVEFAVTRNISISGQYLYLRMLEASAPTARATTSSTDLFDDSANILRVGVNYHFN